MGRTVTIVRNGVNTIDAAKFSRAGKALWAANIDADGQATHPSDALVAFALPK